MKIRFRYLAGILLLATLTVHSQTRTDAKPFHFSSLGTAYGVQGEFEGTYLVEDDSIAVNMTKATIYVSEHCPYQGPRAINQLKFGLGVETSPGGKWKIESAAPPTLLTLVMSPRDKYTLYDSYFLIPKERDIDLIKRWFVVAIQTDPIDAREKELGKGYVFANSCKDIFSQPERTSERESGPRICH